eukprot:1089381-Amphidinium_carterae.2
MEVWEGSPCTLRSVALSALTPSSCMEKDVFGTSEHHPPPSHFVPTVLELAEPDAVFSPLLLDVCKTSYCEAMRLRTV